ncbi:hypothetical protein [Aquimarina sp. I32.4]|uniref:hypothetical protein n=1 Tax=Aquimarina sp. I32.4 TaxID=2053903 RepID=UPI000CDF219C|nr:hypothetical protein [Aquimarina sp. I32.4]
MTVNKELDGMIINLSLIDNDQLKELEILKILKVLDSYELDDFYKYYLKGYLWYNMPFENINRAKEVEHNLKESISKKPDYLFSKAYLAYYYYDNKFYKKVIDVLNFLDFSFFEERNQLWQSLKLQELLAMSKLQISDSVSKDISDDIVGLIYSYIHVPEEEVAVPRELVNVVIENKNKKGILSIKETILLLINSKDYKDYFDNDVRSELTQ